MHSQAPKTTIEIDGTDWRINGALTYAGREHKGRRIEGLLLNSRMVQAVFDDACDETRDQWIYPDTGAWDADRNTDEFCAMLPIYRALGLLAVTVGLQGGGSIYRPEIFQNYVNSGFKPDGSLKAAYLNRIERILSAADACGMVVIVNYFYWVQEPRLDGEDAIKRAVEEMTVWLLNTGYRNVLVDLKNEIQQKRDILSSRRIHELLDVVRSTTVDDRRLLVSTSIHPVKHKPHGSWHEYCDFLMPHGNDSFADEFYRELVDFKNDPDIAANPRPICCNEDSIDIASFDAALDAGVSWGYYDQGYGCGEEQTKCNWLAHERECDYERLSGFQTLPVNWGINTLHKKAFFEHLKTVTGA